MLRSDRACNALVVRCGTDRDPDLGKVAGPDWLRQRQAATNDVHDSARRRTSVACSCNRTNLPTALASPTYNANNQLTNWGGATLTYDSTGNMLTNRTNTRAWNARDSAAPDSVDTILS